MKEVKLFYGDRATIENKINEWLKEAQPNAPDFQMVYAGAESNGTRNFCTIVIYEPSFAKDN